MEKIKLSFELTDIWNRVEFRQLITNIKNKMYDTCDLEYELWIISTNDNPTFVNTVADQLEIPSDRVILCADDSTKIGQIAINSDIHLDGYQLIITALNVTSVHGILVDNKIAYDAIGYKYVQDLDRWTKIILRQRSGGNIEAESC